MAFYIVKANPVEDRLKELREWLDSGDISEMEPFGETLQHSLENARVLDDGRAVWEEEDYCHPPLDMERKAVLDKHFTDIQVEAVERGEGWGRIQKLPSLWEDSDEADSDSRETSPG